MAKRAAILWIALSFLLTGCWDIKDIQDVNFITALGLDYEDGKYVVYAQMLDFSAVAKSEVGKPMEPIPVWVGVGKGSTLVAAFNDLYRTSQLRIFYGQISVYVIGERLIKEDLEKFIDFQRYFEFRYNPWIFGTKHSIHDLLIATPFFNLSPLASLLYQPQESFKQRSVLTPMTYLRFISGLQEPSQKVILPSLAVSSDTWYSNKTPHPLLEIDGGLMFQSGKYRGWEDVDRLPGLPWVNAEMSRHPLYLMTEGKNDAALSLESPDIRITPEVQNGKASFTFDVRLSGYILDLEKEMSETEIEHKAENLVRKEIIELYKRGVQMKVDFLGLEHALYRQNNKEWQRLQSQGGVRLTEESLKNVNVTVRMDHSGKLKMMQF